MMCITSITLTITALDVRPPTDTSDQSQHLMWDHPLTPVAMLCLFLPIIHPVAFTALDVGPPTDTSGQSLHLMCDHPLTPVAMLCLFLPIIHPVASVCVCNSAKLLLKYSALYIVSQNTIPNTSSCNSSKHCPTVIKKILRGD